MPASAVGSADSRPGSLVVSPGRRLHFVPKDDSGAGLSQASPLGADEEPIVAPSAPHERLPIMTNAELGGGPPPLAGGGGLSPGSVSKVRIRRRKKSSFVGSDDQSVPDVADTPLTWATMRRADVDEYTFQTAPSQLPRRFDTSVDEPMAANCVSKEAFDALQTQHDALQRQHDALLERVALIEQQGAASFPEKRADDGAIAAAPSPQHHRHFEERKGLFTAGRIALRRRVHRRPTSGIRDDGIGSNGGVAGRSNWCASDALGGRTNAAAAAGAPATNAPSAATNAALLANVEEAQDTGSLHIWAVALACSKDSSRLQALFAAVVSLLVVSAQVCILTWVNYEASYPTCSSHAECRLGTYCLDQYPRWQNRPRCYDCDALTPQSYWPNFTQAEAQAQASVNDGRPYVPSVRFAQACQELQGATTIAGQNIGPWSDDLKPWDELDHQRFWLTDPERLLSKQIKRDAAPPPSELGDTMTSQSSWPNFTQASDYDRPYVPSVNFTEHVNGTDDGSMGRDHAQLTRACAEYLQCEETNKWKNECDFIHITMLNFDTPQIGVLIFTTLLLILPLATDVDEAVIESALLKRRQHLDAPKTSVHLLSYTLLRVGLLQRRFMLPPLVVMTALAVLVTNELGAANLLLNVLALVFILETDNALSLICLPPAARRLAGPMMVGLHCEHKWAAARVMPLVCSFALVFGVLYIETLLQVVPPVVHNLVGIATVGKCNSLATVLIIGSVSIPLIGVAANIVGQVASDSDADGTAGDRGRHRWLAVWLRTLRGIVILVQGIGGWSHGLMCMTLAILACENVERWWTLATNSVLVLLCCICVTIVTKAIMKMHTRKEKMHRVYRRLGALIALRKSAQQASAATGTASSIGVHAPREERLVTRVRAGMARLTRQMSL